ncbi:hypothetical protein Gotur_002476 [Gossypium turneri]
MNKDVPSNLNRLTTFEDPADHAQSLLEKDAHQAMINIDSHQPNCS